MQLPGRALFCGLYINELLLKLTARQDASADLFDGYATAIAGLAGPPSEPVLRRFEVGLLQHLGLGLSWNRMQRVDQLTRRAVTITTSTVGHGGCPVTARRW